MIPAHVSTIGYCRVSTEHQAEESRTSLADQREAVSRLAERLGRRVGIWYRDKASGATVEQRPAFRAMLAACAASPRPRRAYGYILALNDSRFGRFPDPEQSTALRWRLKESGWLVRFAETDDINDPTFRSLVRAMGAAQASEYRRQLSANTIRGSRGTAAQGFWRGSAPYGYRRRVAHPQLGEVLQTGEFKRPHERVMLVPHDFEAPIVAWAFERYAAGDISLSSLGKQIHARDGLHKWNSGSVSALLHNPAYAGHVLVGRRRQDEWKCVTAVPREQWYGKLNAHEPIVSQELWDTVQRVLQRRWFNKTLA